MSGTYGTYVSRVCQAREEHPNWRTGQAAFRVLQIMRPDLALKIRGQELDPYLVENVRATFWQWVEESW